MRATGSTSAKRAQMTRRMACTQSSMSRWELAMSRSASGLSRHLLPLPAPPARQREQAYCRLPGRHGVPPSRALSGPTPAGFHSLGVRQLSLQKPFSSSCAFWFYICTSPHLAYLSLGPSWVSPLAFLFFPIIKIILGYY